MPTLIFQWCLACFISFLLVIQPAFPGSSPRDRMIAAGIAQSAKVVSQGIKTLDAAYATELAGKPSSVVQDLTFKYRKAHADQQFQLEGIRFAHAVRDGALVLGGPVGIAAAATFHATTDRLIEKVISEQGDKQRKIFANSLAKLSDAQFAELQKGTAADRTAKFAQFTETLWSTDTFAGLDAEAKQAVRDVGHALMAKTTVQVLKEARTQGKTVLQIKTGMQQLSRDVAKTSKDVANLEKAFQGLSAKTDDIRQSVDQLVRKDFDKSSPAEQLEYLQRGGVPFPDPTERKKAFEQAKARLAQQQIAEGLEVSLGVVRGLETFAKLIDKSFDPKPFREAAKTVQTAQAAYGVFIGFATGGPIGGLMALGSVGGMFGDGGDGGAAQFAQLEAISGKLDRVIDLQIETLQKIADLQISINELSFKIDQVKAFLEDATSATFASIYDDALKRCPELLKDSSFRIPKADGNLRSLELPLSDPREFVHTHYLTPQSLALLTGNQNKCFQGIERLLANRQALEFIAPTGAQGRSAWAQKDTFDALLKFTGSEYPSLSSRILGAFLSEPSATVFQLRERDALLRQPDKPKLDGVPCTWQGPDIAARCTWMRLTPGTDDVLPLSNYLHPYVSLFAADLSLMFYHQPMIPKSFPKLVAGASPKASVAAYAKSWTTGASEEPSIKVLEQARWRTQMATAQQALLQGDLAAARLGERMIAPNRMPSELEKANCTEPHLRGLDDGKILGKNHVVGRNAVLFALSRVLWPDNKPKLNTLALKYAQALSSAPRRDVILFEKDPADSKLYRWRGAQRAQDEEIHWQWLRELLNKDGQANLQWQFVFGRFPADRTTWKKVSRGAGEACGAYKVEDTAEAAVPVGWSVVIGKEQGLQFVVPLPSIDSLLSGTLEWTPLVQALYQRSSMLTEERMAFEINVTAAETFLIRRGHMRAFQIAAGAR